MKDKEKVESDRQAWLERAAIAEYDGELTRAEAEQLADELHPVWARERHAAQEGE